METIDISKYLSVAPRSIFWAGCGRDVVKELIGINKPKNDEQYSPCECH